jgi:Flp pilus assembly protein TadG
MPDLTHQLRELHGEDRGQMAIGMLLAFLIVFMLFALALDAGLWYFDHRQAQNQVDAAALAAIQELPDSNTTDAASAAQSWLGYNGVSQSLTVSANCTGMTAGTARIVFSNADSQGKYRSVRVCVRRSSSVLFSGMSGVTNAVVSAGATAALEMKPLTYALMAMNPDPCSGDGAGSLRVRGNATVNLLEDGGSYTRSACNEALFIDGGNAVFNAEGTHDVVGQCAPSTRCLSAQVNPDPTNNYSDMLSDPWADIAQPVPGACRSDLAPSYTSGTHDIAPGTYCDPLVVSSSATVRLQSGTHIFRAGLMVSGNSPKLLSSGPVLLYMTCQTGTACCPSSGSCTNVPPQAPGCSTVASFCLQGGEGSTVAISGPASEPQAVIWVDRTAACDTATDDLPKVRIAGQGSIDLDGNIYAIGCKVELQGQGDAQVVSLAGTVVADKIDFGGQATYNVTWDEDIAPKDLSYGLIE